MRNDDKTLENLLDLDGVRYVIDDHLGLWVKFEIMKVLPSKDRPHGIKYSLTVHDRFNKRLIGFDNAHAIEFGGKRNVAPTRLFDHWHRDGSDFGRPYHYVTAGKLVEDFWIEVEKMHMKLKED